MSLSTHRGPAIRWPRTGLERTKMRRNLGIIGATLATVAAIGISALRLTLTTAIPRSAQDHRLDPSADNTDIYAYSAPTPAGSVPWATPTTCESFCSLAGRPASIRSSGADHRALAAVWARFYARSFGKAQRDEARRRMLGTARRRCAEVAGISLAFRRFRPRPFPTEERKPRLCGAFATPRVGLEPTTLRLTAGCSAN